MSCSRLLGALAVTAASAFASVGIENHVASAAPVLVPSSVETVPGAHAGDSMDDPAIWVHPTNPAQSLVFANDKLGALDVYNLDGSLQQRLADEVNFWGNVDVRQTTTVAGVTRDIVAVTHRGIQFYGVDPTTRQLYAITDGVAVGSSAEGLCMYDSPVSGKAYVINITITGRLRQYELGDTDRDGLVDVQLVRDVEVGSEAEGCVADDETGALFVSEEDVALWRYDAEPTGGTARTVIDRPVPDGGRLQPDIEGVTLATLPGGAGYVMVSAQNVADPSNSSFAVYQRAAPHAFVSTFRVSSGPTSDDCDRTDGIAVTTANLGPAFPEGMFVCQDNNNDAPGVAGNQDLKFVRLETIVDLAPGTNAPPVAAIAPSCAGLVCSFDGTGSSDPDGSVVGYTWNFGDGSAPATGAAASHSYAAAGTYTVTLTVTDDDGGTDSAAVSVTVSTAPDEAVSFVGRSVSANANATRWTTTVPAGVHAGDLLLAWFPAGSALAVTGPGTGWQQVDRAVDEVATTLWWRVASATDAGSSVAVTSALQKGVLTVAAYRGVDVSAPFAARGVATQPALTTQHTTPSLTNPVADGWRVSFWALKSSSVNALTAPAGEAARSTTNGTGSGRVTTLLTDSAAGVPVGPQGDRTAVSDATANKGTFWTLVLRPSATTPPPNEAPTASASYSCQGLACAFDGSGSSDPDGTVVGYSWDFGDDTGPGTGVAPSHTYDAGGTYAVTLTVTDDAGESASTTVIIAVTVPSAAVSFVAQSSSPNANTTRWSTTVPSTVQAGDVLLAWFSSGSSGLVVTGPGGAWQQVERSVDDVATTLWWKVATAADGATTVQVTSTQQKGVLTLVAYRGVDTAAPFAARGVSTQPNLVTQHTTASVTNPVGDGWRVSFWALKSSGVGSLTPPGGDVARSTTNGTGGGRVTTLLSDSGGGVAAGAQGSRTAISDTTSNKGTFWTIVLRPA